MAPGRNQCAIHFDEPRGETAEIRKLLEGFAIGLAFDVDDDRSERALFDRQGSKYDVALARARAHTRERTLLRSVEVRRTVTVARDGVEKKPAQLERVVAQSKRCGIARRGSRNRRIVRKQQDGGGAALQRRLRDRRNRFGLTLW
ncbi:MAG TPA: hypothetical protein VFE36_09080 [Candidatus Baltobacteraceae bacterium]|nr:hypothetical protein [Candidatus Baltobacteraceae bacterium]